MAYVLVVILALLIIAVAVFAASRLRQEHAPFGGRDHTPLGDTTEHAGDQDARGRTTSRPDAWQGGTGEPISRPQNTGAIDGRG